MKIRIGFLKSHTCFNLLMFNYIRKLPWIPFLLGVLGATVFIEISIQWRALQSAPKGIHKQDLAQQLHQQQHDVHRDDMDPVMDMKLFKDKAVYIGHSNHDSYNIQFLKEIPKVGDIKGNTTEAEKLFHKVRVLCWIPTTPYNFFKRSVYVLHTWGRRCNKLFFFISKSTKDPVDWKRSMSKKGLDVQYLEHGRFLQNNLEIIELNNTEKGSYDLTYKVFSCWLHLYSHHLSDADWFIKADDDTYVIMENLRHFLSKQDSNSPVYYGHRFLLGNSQYHSGGSGYVMSRRTLINFATSHKKMCDVKSGTEDLQMGKCLMNLGVNVGDARDEKGRAYFYPLGPMFSLTGVYPKWFKLYDPVSSRHIGITGFPRLPISFHYVGQQRMLELELFIYYINTFGGSLLADSENEFYGGMLEASDSKPAAEKYEKHKDYSYDYA